jgi:hypothetical protein
LPAAGSPAADRVRPNALITVRLTEDTDDALLGAPA